MDVAFQVIKNNNWRNAAFISGRTVRYGILDDRVLADNSKPTRGTGLEGSAHGMLNRKFESQGKAVIQFLRWI